MNESRSVKISLMISALSLVVALIAAASSLYSITITKKKHILDRSLILLAEYNLEHNKILIQPLNVDVKLLRARIHFPPSFSMIQESINSHGYTSDMSIFEVNARHMISQIYKEIKNNLLYAIQVPVVIESYYAVRGNTYTDTSQYILSMKLKFENVCSYFPTVYDADIILREKEVIWNESYKLHLEDIFEDIIKNKMVTLPARKPASDL